MMFLNYKKFIFISCVITSSVFSNQLSAEVMECTTEEVGLYLSKEGLVDLADTMNPTDQEYQDAFLTYKEKEKEKEGTEDCFSILSDKFDFSEYARKINELIDSISLPSGDAVEELYEKAMKKIQEELQKSLCERVPAAVSGFWAEQKEAMNNKINAYKTTARNKTILKYKDDNTFDSWMNKKISERIDDENDFINWRNGIEGGLEVDNGNSRKWENVLDEIF